MIKSLRVSLISTRPLKVLTYLSSSNIDLVSSSQLDHGNRLHQRIALGPPFLSRLSLSPPHPMPSKFPFQHHFFNAQQKSQTKTKRWHTTYMYISTSDIRSDLFTLRHMKKKHWVPLHLGKRTNHWKCQGAACEREKAWNSTRWKWQHMSSYTLALSPQQCVLTVVW